MLRDIILLTFSFSLLKSRYLLVELERRNQGSLIADARADDLGMPDRLRWWTPPPIGPTNWPPIGPSTNWPDRPLDHWANWTPPPIGPIEIQTGHTDDDYNTEGSGFTTDDYLIWTLPPKVDNIASCCDQAGVPPTCIGLCVPKYIEIPKYYDDYSEDFGVLGMCDHYFQTITRCRSGNDDYRMPMPIERPISGPLPMPIAPPPLESA